MNIQERRIQEAAERYIQSDRSDPFARNRVMSHLKSGLASVDKDGRPHYDATPMRVLKHLILANGRILEWSVWEYTDVARA